MKYIKSILIFIILIITLTSCLKKEASDDLDQLNHNGAVVQNSQNEDFDKTLTITTTLVPVYHWVKAIIGDELSHISIRLLQSDTSDIHNYEPDVDDLLFMSQSDVFIYVGGESESWVLPTLEKINNEDLLAISLFEILGEDGLIKLHDGYNGKSHYDEHIWLSLNNAILFVDKISKEFAKIDKSHAKAFNDNALIYIDKLMELDRQYHYAINNSKRDTVIIADRFPFAYMFEDYNLNYYAPIDYCTDSLYFTPESKKFLAKKIQETNTKTIFKLSDNSNTYAEDLLAEYDFGNIDLQELNPIQDTSAYSSSIHDDYLLMMRENLKLLLKALNE